MSTVQWTHQNRRATEYYTVIGTLAVDGVLLLHLVQRGGARARAAIPLYQCDSPPIHGQCSAYQLHII